MDEQPDWIPAYEALERLVAARFDARTAMRTICERAHAGLVRAKAELFKLDDDERTNLEVPKKFWWAKGEAALDQNWRSGDFSTWLDQTYHLQAFGVYFALSDIEKLIPAESRRRTTMIFTEEDKNIEECLNSSISDSAALSWKQALLDLNDDERISFRGTALEMREALREVLDKLAPDQDVEKSDGYKKQPDRNKPTQKQKVRYILKRKGKAPQSATEEAIAAFEESIASLTRSVYELSSKSTHVSSRRQEVIQLRRYLVAGFHDVLDI